MRPFTLVIVLSCDAAMTEGTKTMLLERQKEYKLAALRAKKEGDMEQAKLYFKTSKYSWFTLDFFCPHLSAVQLLELLESRKKQYMKAALQAKQKNDMEQAKVFLRTAKGLDPMIEAARSGKTVDISTVSTQPKATF
ncbi:hypothetical protein XENOCAPTIV_022779 [Xenoophorus captivus]|uniref:DM14 domain-containing protein n=1 Tax=Xenoophorus captivus TaxID=1517983 RepID=A0ABV0QP10_9TELE